MGDLGSCTSEISTESGPGLRFRSGSFFGDSFSSITTSPCVTLSHHFLPSYLKLMNGIIGLPQSLISQGSQLSLHKPAAGCHYDFVILGLTTFKFLAGLLGVLAPIGLVSQAPIHTLTLLVHVLAPKEEALLRDGDDDRLLRELPITVVEQWVSNLVRARCVLCCSPTIPAYPKSGPQRCVV